LPSAQSHLTQECSGSTRSLPEALHALHLHLSAPKHLIAGKRAALRRPPEQSAPRRIAMSDSTHDRRRAVALFRSPRILWIEGGDLRYDWQIKPLPHQ